ncbi:hypothetical protein HOF65_01220 [bacterium]|nr:hypothetical protein [bacterium]MBT3852657.1 hypothetical protein [bacterium]MBT4633620.1 hypothetical protein [bacterium]MBT6779274.1 hypothetical protein [bacterium]
MALNQCIDGSNEFAHAFINFIQYSKSQKFCQFDCIFISVYHIFFAYSIPGSNVS